MSRAPSAATIRRALALTQLSSLPADRLSRCDLCEGFVDHLIAYREHDENDYPIPGNAALLFVGYEHEECERRVEEHPRRYELDAASPGAFPLLCGDCSYREGLACEHPSLKANGGPGLKVEARNPVIFHTTDGCFATPRVAETCAGKARFRLVEHNAVLARAATDRLIEDHGAHLPAGLKSQLEEFARSPVPRKGAS